MDHSRSSSKTCGCALRSFSADWHTGTTWVIQQQVRDLNSTWTVDHPISSQSTGGYWFDSGAVRPSISSGVRQALHRVGWIFSLPGQPGRGTRETNSTLARLHISNPSCIYRRERPRFSSHETVEDRVSSDADPPCHIARKRLRVWTSCLIVYTIRSRISTGIPMTRRPLCSSPCRSIGLLLKSQDA